MGAKIQVVEKNRPQVTCAALRQRCTIQKPGDHHVSTLKMRQHILNQYVSESYKKDLAYIKQVPLQVRELRITAYYKKLEEQLLGPITESQRLDTELAYMNEVPFHVRSQIRMKFMEPRWQLLELMRQQPNYNPFVYQTMTTHFFLQQNLYMQQQMKLHYERRKVLNRDSLQQQQLPVTSPTEEDTLTERMQKISLAIPMASLTEEDIVTEGLQKLGLAE